MLIIEQALLEQLEDELHRAARPPETLSPGSPEAVRQRRMASVLEEVKSIPLSPVEQAMLTALENPLERACAYWERTDPFGGPGAPNAAEIVYDFIAKETFIHRDGQLYERMSGEFAAYLDGLRDKDPQDIIDAAYQITIKTDILSLMESHTLTLPQIDVLLTLEYPLDSIYQEWLANDYSHMDMLRDTLDSFVEEERNALARHAHDQGGKPPERLRDYYETYEADPEPPGEEDLER